MTNFNEVISLKDGPCVPLDVIRILMDLSDRGWSMERRGDKLAMAPRKGFVFGSEGDAGPIGVRRAKAPRPEVDKTWTRLDTLSEEDRESIKTHKQDLLLVVDYIEATK